MKEFGNINDILDFAINAEQEAVDFYNGLAAKLTNEAMRKVFVQFAHKRWDTNQNCYILKSMANLM